MSGHSKTRIPFEDLSEIVEEVFPSVDPDDMFLGNGEGGYVLAAITDDENPFSHGDVQALIKAAAEKGHTLPMPDIYEDEDGDYQGWQWPTVRITGVDE